VNVFCLDKDPRKSAEMMCDKHVVKMILESCQILSAVLDVNYIDEYRGKTDVKPSFQLGCPGYPPAHVKHPSTLWAIESKGNAKWLIKHLRALNMEYTKRYMKTHKLAGCTMIYEAQLQYLKFSKERKTKFTQAITNKKWHNKDSIEAYRTYYNMEKFIFAKWKLGNIPEWFTGPPNYNIELTID
tara:strand:- start:7770 stop:8324 length:555 start_codon:yes stop_codon:yes gene_type:complete